MNTHQAARFLLQGQVVAPGAARWQDLLAQAHRGKERPLCLCRPSGVGMYVARHQRFLLKRLPGTGHLHASGCACHVPDQVRPAPAGTTLQGAPAAGPNEICLEVDFAWDARRQTLFRPAPGDSDGSGAAPVRQRMSLRDLLLLLLVRAGFHRWTPAMAGKRNPVVLHRYLMGAAHDVRIGGVPLRERLQVCQPQARGDPRGVLPDRSRLHEAAPGDARVRRRMALVGEIGRVERQGEGLRVWLKHLSGVSLVLPPSVWSECLRHGRMPADVLDGWAKGRVRLLLASLTPGRVGGDCMVDAAALVPLSLQWIPVDRLDALPLVEALVARQRRFATVLPIRQPADRSPPCVWLLDGGGRAVPLWVGSAQDPVLHDSGSGLHEPGWSQGRWIWRLDRPLPPFPAKR